LRLAVVRIVASFERAMNDLAFWFLVAALNG